MATSRDHNKTRSLKNMKLWLKVLTEHCHQDVITHYNKLTEEHQKQQFLEVLKGNVLTQNRLLMEGELELECVVYEVKPDNYYMTLTEAIRGEDVEPNLMALEQLPRWLEEQTNKYKQLLVHAKTVHMFSKKSSEKNVFAYHWSINPNSDYSRRTANFSGLRKIMIKDLHLGTSTGCYIKGKLITEPMVSTGVTTFMEDETGQYMMVGIYNMIPGNASRNKVAAMKFPFGTRIRIAEPFLKIFLDGNVGVRVDAPGDLEILKGNDEDDIDRNKAQEDAQNLVMRGSYLEALQIYWDALRGFPEVSTLLNNRAQCEISLKQYEVAVLDAAVVLLLDERNEKARNRFQTAAKKLGLNQNQKMSVKNVWLKLLRALKKDDIAVGGGSVAGTKEKGNKFMKAGRYSEAKFEYTKALDDSDICPILDNLSVVCLKTEMYHTAIAVANASLRIAKSSAAKKKARFAMTKAFSMLGEITFAKICGDKDESLKEFWDDSRKPINVIDKVTLNLLGMQRSLKMGEAMRGENIPIDYLAPDTIKHDHIAGKGRGMIATRDIVQGELLLVDHMIYTQASSSSTECTSFVSGIQSDSSNQLAEKFMMLTRHDGLLAKKFLLLDTKKTMGETDEHRLPLVTDLQWFGYRSFSFLTPPFMSQTPYELHVEDGAVTSDLIRRLLATNVFSCAGQPDDGTSEGSGLMLRVSLFNHDENPNCINQLAGDGAVVYAAKPIKKGEELCINYGFQ